VGVEGMKGRITADLKAKGKRLIEVKNARQLIMYAKDISLILQTESICGTWRSVKNRKRRAKIPE